jgi:uncharacterized metal-binding protein YceD (DUF177 family)
MSYKINLKSIHSDKEAYHYTIDHQFFDAIEGSLVHEGNLDVDIEMKKTSDQFEAHIGISGYVLVPCVRCLDDIHQDISVEEVVKVRLTPSTQDEGETILEADAEGLVDFTSLIYDDIILALPINPIHKEGECNKEMIDRLSQYLIN